MSETQDMKPFMKQLQLAEVWINTFHRSLWGRAASEERIESTHQIKTITGLQMQPVY